MVLNVTFEKEQAINLLYNSMCNGGLSELAYSSVIVDWDSQHNFNNYQNAKNRLLKKGQNNICREDVWTEILLFGDTIQFTDYEGDEEIISLHLEDAIKNCNSLSVERKIELLELIDEDNCNADAFDYCNAIQLCLFGDVIYG
jgi:hypothetical protein